MALQTPVDLVLLDIMLPNESGLSVLARLRQERGTPVILMFALGDEQDRITGFSQGADDYLPKPFSVNELDARMDALLRRVAIDRAMGSSTQMTDRCPVELDLRARRALQRANGGADRI